MKLLSTPLAGMYEIVHTPVVDERGRFTRLFCEEELALVRPALHFMQINLSQTCGIGTLRGLHYQKPPAAEAKLIRCLKGRVFDVAVDIRAGSPTFLQWHAVELAADNDRAIFIPEGLAHGFQALAEDVELLYMHTAPWTPSCEAGLRHDDPSIGVDWPLPAINLSARDQAYASIDLNFRGVRL